MLVPFTCWCTVPLYLPHFSLLRARATGVTQRSGGGEDILKQERELIVRLDGADAATCGLSFATVRRNGGVPCKFNPVTWKSIEMHCTAFGLASSGDSCSIPSVLVNYGCARFQLNF
ncbi:hypothetical protein DM02DRAFT_409539 [Periconia macrospinosa]|uniref:Uncharacterized protein n=1 Tax=Periconia macrospinosa TaxID=97972 RepID=A0A2V1EB02_9PLEO|nr:hypothetical protein DM02DRAFT_409539 [Periconia macrospinosa]